MSNSQSGLQSGIKVSPALVTAFNEASAASSSTRALKISIIEESLEPNGSLDRTSSEKEDFSKIPEWVSDDEAVYVLYFLDSPNRDHYIFVSYVPDTSNVRQKMLYASTRATLISTLGLRTQRLANQIIATSKAELTFPEAEAPVDLSELSIREKELKEVKAAEAESAQGTSMRTAMVSSSGVSFPVSEDAKNAIAALVTEDGEKLIQLCIHHEIIELASINEVAKGEEIRDIIFEDEPRFTFFRFVHDYKGSEVSPIIFIYSFPQSSSIKQRMVYASSRGAILSVAAELGVKVDTKVETSEVDELTLKYLTREIHGADVVEEKKAFARPRGPPRRNQ